MYCIECGNEIEEGSTKCSKCGHIVEVNTSKDETNDNISTDNNEVINAVEEEIIASQNNNSEVINNSTNKYDFASNGLLAGSVIFPPLGIVNYFSAKKEFPNKAMLTLKAAIIGIVIYLIATLVFIFLIIPIINRYALKLECEVNTPGSKYNMQTYTCVHPDGSMEVKMPKK